MPIVEQKTPTAGDKSTPMLGCRRENSTVRSQRSRRVKRLENRLAAAFLADGYGGYGPAKRAYLGGERGI